MPRRALAAACLLAAGCGTATVRVDGGLPDSGAPDGGSTADAGSDAGLPDAGTGTDGGSDAGGPAHLAGTYSPGPVDFTVQAPAGARKTALVQDLEHDVAVAIFTDVEAGTGNHRTRVRTIRHGAPPTIGGGLLVDDAVAVNTLEPELVAGRDAQGSRLLAVWEDARVGNGNGYREIYGQFLRADAAGGLTPLGGNFNLTDLPAIEEYSPCAAFDPAAGYLVAWSDSREVSLRADGRVLFAKTVSPSGALGPELRLGDTANWQMSCRASGGPGRFLVVWHDYLPAAGGLDTGYRARLVENGQPLALQTLGRIGDLSPDPPAIAWNSRQREWLIAWIQGPAGPSHEIRGTLMREDGSLRRTDLLLGAHPEGAGVPHLAYSPRTNSYLLAFHAWITNDAYAQELDHDGNRVGAVPSVNAAVPTLGTFYTPVAASLTASRFLVVMMQNYTRQAGTYFTSPAALPW